MALKISVVTATWNSGGTIEDTLRSVLGQSYGNIEHIVVDGGSCDDTLNIVRRYAEEYRKRGLILKWISERDNGIYDAMNKGIRLATGDVIGLLNSDDFFTSSRVLERVAEELCRGNDSENSDDCGAVDAVYGDIHYVKPENPDKCVRYYSSRSFCRSKMRMGFMPAHPSFYCRREVYSQYGLFDTDFKIAADFELLLRLIFIHRIKTRYIELDFVTMRTGGASSSGFASHRQIYAEHRRAYRKNKVYSNCLFEAIRYLYKIAEICRAKWA